jgi:hypothetical protein
MYKGSFFRSTDGGNNWQTMFQDADFVWMCFLENAPECMLALNEKNEFYYSTNQGANWISLGQVFSAFDSSPNNDWTDLKRISLVAGKLIVYGEEQYAPNHPFYIANTTYNNGVLSISNQQLGTDFLFGLPLQNNTFVIGVGVSNRVNNQVYMTLVLKDTTDNVSPIYSGFSYKLNSNSISVVHSYVSTSNFTNQYGSVFPLYAGIGLPDKYELIQSVNEPNKFIYHACVDPPIRYEINSSTSLINPLSVILSGSGHHADYRCSNIISYNGVDNIYFGNDGGVAKFEYANNPLVGNNLLSINGDLSNNLIHYFDLDESTKNIALMFQDMKGKIMLPNGSFSTVYGHEGSAVMMSRTWNGKLVTEDTYSAMSMANVAPFAAPSANNGRILITPSFGNGAELSLGSTFKSYRHFQYRFIRAASLQTRNHNYVFSKVLMNRDSAQTFRVSINDLDTSGTFAVGVCERNPNHLYAGDDVDYNDQDVNRLAMSHDDGLTWTKTDANTMVTHTNSNGSVEIVPFNNILVWKMIKAISVDHYDGNKMYLSPSRTYVEFSGTQNDWTPIDEKYRVLKTTNGGLSFTDYSEGLPALPVDEILTIDSENELIFCANAVGVFYRTKDMIRWECFSKNLPDVEVTHMQYDYCSSELYVSTYGRGMWKSFVPMRVSTGGTRDITVSTTWQSSQTVNQHIKVKSGVTLTIKNATINMLPDLKIFVEPGARLVVDNSTITNKCGNYWHGIEVWGNASQPQQLATQGRVSIINNSVIEFAREAFVNMNPENWNSIGGIILASNSTFRNNRRSAAFLQYHYINPSTGNEVPYLSYFTNCNFIWDNAFNTNLSISPAITLWSVNGVRITGCTFDEQRTNLTLAQKHSGIGALNAKFEVVGRPLNILNVPFHESYNETGYDVSIFKNLHTAISARSHLGVVVDHVKFDNCQNGVLFDELNNGNITRNFFLNNTVVSLNPVQATLRKSSGYKVEGNIFQGTTNTNDVTGVLVDNSGINANQIYKNSFIRLQNGIIANGQNQNGMIEGDPQPIEGLVLYCNTNTNIPGTDQRNKVDNSIDLTQGMRWMQGASSKAARNTFTASTASTVKHIRNFDPDVMKYFHLVGEQPTLIQGNVTTSQVGTNSNTCASTFQPVIVNPTGVLSSGGLLITKSQFTNLEGNFGIQKSELESLIEAGKSQVLLALLNGMNNSNKQEVKAELEAKSPYLSADVLLLTGQKDNNLVPRGWFKNLVIANIEAANDNTLRTWLEANMSAGHWQQINTALQNQYSERSVKVDGLMVNVEERAVLSSDILKGIISDSTEIDWADYKLWLLKQDDYLKQAELTEIALDQKQFSKASEYMDLLKDQAANETNPLLKQELLDYLDFREYIQSFYYSEQMLQGLNKDQIATLINFRDNSTGIASYQANNILCFFENVCKEYDIEGITKSTQFESSFTFSDTKNPNSYIVQPNPNNGRFSIQNISVDEVSEILLFDMEGRKISFEQTDFEDGVSFKTENLSNGLYLMRIHFKDGSNAELKFTIIN